MQHVARETMSFLKQQVVRYERYESRNAAFDMMQTTDRARMLARNLQEKPELLNSVYLEDYAYAQRLDGIIVFNEQKQIDDCYCISKVMREQVLQKAAINNVDDVLRFPLRSYMDQFVNSEDGDVYSYAIAGRLDKPGYILAYRKESTRAEADSQSYMDGLFSSYGFELDGTVLITDGKRVLSSNRPDFKKRSLEALMPNARTQLCDEGDGVYSISYNNEIYYGVIEQYKNYRLVAFFPKSAVFADRTRNMSYVLLICILFGVVLMYLHYRSSQSHYQQLGKQYATIRAISSFYEVVFLLNLEKNKLEVVQIPPEAAGLVQPGDDAMGWLKEMMAANVSVEYRGAMSVFNSAENIRIALKGKSYLSNEYEDIHGRWMNSLMIPQSYDEQGRVKAVLLATYDITETKAKEFAYQKQLQETAQEAQSASIAKTDFLRRMSHDIRTPLNGILGILEMANYYPCDMDKQQEYRDKVMENTKILLELSNDVLEMNKIESGQIVLAEKSFDAEQVIRSIGMMTEAQAKLRAIDCQRSFEVQHKNLIGSPVHLRQILTNLASNALKYNKDYGSITLSCKELECADDVVKLELICADTGIGMSKEFEAHAFDMFAQEVSEARTSYVGTGLGLAIVKRLVELMGGTLELQSEKNVGTTFRVVLPFKLDHNPPPVVQEKTAAAGATLKGMKVLLVEDNALNMKIEEFVLEREGAVLTKAMNGQEAVNTFAASAEGDFDVVLMDIMMPVMDGLTATRAIRELERSDAQAVPIIALSANAFAEDEAEGQKAGLNGYLAKPLNAQQLIKILQQYAKN